MHDLYHILYPSFFVDDKKVSKSLEI